ncbi:MAG TPA: ATP-binding cassette domain-containing protein [Gemmatimonadaceae bacterium]|jgi:osmoprotectant transport system ATP-binding protein|nr:ATP-binding cassette domain-containing protein [Gemmatimonadaceae bacterium]
MPTPGAALTAESVHRRFGTVTALDGVSMHVAPGETVALVGESGSGKTTLLRCFNALTRPDAGRVLVDDLDVATSDPVALRRRMGYVQQDGGLLPHWTVQRNVELVPRLRGHLDADNLARAAMELVGLDPALFARRWPRELSGGQRQRVAFARALAVHPGALLLDEPFGALDAISRSELREVFSALRARLHITTLIVTHDVAEAVELADRIVVLRAGRVEQDAPPAELLAHPATAYVGTLLERAGVHA